MATMTEAALVVDAIQVSPPDPEVPARAKRRTYTREYKLRLLAETDAAPAGTVASILRREGLYSSILSEFRNQRDQGRLTGEPPRRGRKPNPNGAEIQKLRRENERLRDELEKARAVIDIQKKVTRLLEALQPTDGQS